ncbi:MAG TPA: hypothetical protein VIM42_08170 [Clostridium sp.]
MKRVSNIHGEGTPPAKSIISIIKTSDEGIHRREYKDTIEKSKRVAEEFAGFVIIIDE